MPIPCACCSDDETDEIDHVFYSLYDVDPDTDPEVLAAHRGMTEALTQALTVCGEAQFIRHLSMQILRMKASTNSPCMVNSSPV